MPEYCEEFRFIESQIYDMAFPDRLLNFSKSIPVELALHIRNSDLQSKDMEVVYQLARQWATSAITSRALQSPGHHRSKHRESKPLLKFGKKHRKLISKKKDDSSDSDDSIAEHLDKMERQMEAMEHVNRIDMQAVICYNCEKRGHFTADCKSPPKASSSRTTTRQAPTSIKGKENRYFKRKMTSPATQKKN